MHLLVVNLLCIWSCTCLMLCTVGRYFVLIFRIPTVFDIIPLELVRFRNSRYSVSSCSFSCPACPFSLSHFKCKSRKWLRSFSTEFNSFHPYLRPAEREEKAVMLVPWLARAAEEDPSGAVPMHGEATRRVGASRAPWKTPTAASACVGCTGTGPRACRE